MRRLKEIFLSFRKRAAAIASTTAVMALTSIAVFAEETGGTDTSAALDAMVIKEADLMPLFNAVASNLGVILKVGIPLFGLFLAVSIIPKAIRYFTK